MKLLKFIGIAFGVVITLLIVAGVFVWLTFDPNDYKGYVADWVSEKTGREFVIEDDLELTFFPWLGVTTGSMRLGNAPGFGDDPFASIERATVSVRLLPLLKRQVEIGTVRLDGLELNLASDSGGTTNWSDLVDRGDAAPAPATPATATTPILQSLNIAGIDINDGLIFWRSNGSDVRYVVSELAAETGSISAGQPIDGELSFRLVGVDPQLSADVTAAGTLAVEPDGSAIDARGLRVSFNLADGRGNERATGALQIANVRARRDGSAIDISRGNVTARLVAPPVGPPQTEVQLDWSAVNIDPAAGTLQVVDLASTVAGIVARWELGGTALLTEPELSGSVRLTGQNLASVFAAIGVELADDTARGLGSVDFESAFVLHPATRTAALTNVAVRALGIDVTGEARLDADGAASGRFATPPFDPRRALELIPGGVPDGIDLAALGTIGVSGTITYEPTTATLTVDGFDLGLLGTHVTGSATRREGGQRYDGRVTVPPIDAATIASIAGERFPAALPPAGLGRVALRSAFAYTPNAQSVELTDISVQAAELDIAAELRVVNLGGSPTFAGRIETTPFNLQRLLARFDHDIGERSDPTVLRRAELSARVEGGGSHITARELKAVIDDSTITGQLDLAMTETPEYAFELAIDRLDADRYLPPAAEAEAGVPEAGPADVALPVDALHGLILDGTIRVGALKIAGLDLERVAASIGVNDGLGVVDSASASLYGGSFQGRVELDGRGEQPRLALDGTATTIGIEPLLSDLRGEANMTGTGSFDLSLAGNGAALGAVLDSSEGRVSFAVRDGELRGFDLGRTLCSAYNATQKLPRPPAAATPVTRYQLLRGSATVNEGIARTEDLEASTAFLAVSGRGQSDLVSREINYDLIATMTGSIGIMGCESMDPLIGVSIPVRATGTILAPDIQPDYGEIVRGRIRDELQDRLRDRLQGLGQ